MGEQTEQEATKEQAVSVITDGVTVEKVKLYLRIDTDEDDDFLLLVLDAARSYLVSQIGTCDESDGRIQMLIYGIAADLYEKRSFSVDKAGTAGYLMNAMVAQLQYEQGQKGGTDA